VIEFFKKFGVAKLLAIFGTTAGVAISLVLITVRIGQPQYSVLHSNLEYETAQTIIQELENTNTPYKIKETGSRVALMVPRKTIGRLRTSLAEHINISSDVTGYEIFDGQQPFGVTSFQQNINRIRAREGELSRTLSSIQGVRSARVHLVLPERTLFQRDQQPTTASIMIESTKHLDPSRVRAIINLAASAVPELTPDHITILDAQGNLLASARGENDEAMAENMMGDRMLAAQTRIKTHVEDLVGSIVGPENVRTQVSADFDFSRFTETSEIVDPDSQVVLSSTLIEETSDNSNPAGRGVSISNALPGAAQATQEQNSTSSNRRSEEVTNYEITKTVRNAVRDEGLVVNRLSVAVAINARASDGSVIERTPEEISNIEALVKSAVGFDAGRGDQVEIANIAFAPLANAPSAAFTPATQASTPLLSQEHILRLAELIALVLIALALVQFILRPLIAGQSITIGNDKTENAITAVVADSHNQNLQNIPDQSANPQAKLLEQRVNIAQIDGQVNASTVTQIQEIVKSHTDESALIIKRWIREAI